MILFLSSLSCLSCSSVVLKIVWRVGKASKSFCEAMGPIPGKPSSMNCFCSSGVLWVLDCLSPMSGLGFSYRLAVRIRKFAVSSSSSV